MDTIITTMAQFLATIFTGKTLAVLGAGIAVLFAGIGSAKGVGMVSEAGTALLAEDPSKFGKAMLLQALPATQGIYGFVVALLILFVSPGLFGSSVELSIEQGMYLFAACLPIAIGGWMSAVKQARVSAAGINMLAKRPDAVGKAIINSALVEMYAILSFLVSMLLVLFYSSVFPA